MFDTVIVRFHYINTTTTATTTFILYVAHEWSAWSPWTNCTVQCGQGHQKRTRTCLPSSARRRDVDCFGLGEEIKVCDAGSCASQLREYMRLLVKCLTPCLSDFKVCDKLRIFTSIFHSSNVNHTGSPTCPDNVHHAAVAVIEEFCSAPTDTSRWTAGIQVRQQPTGIH
ncbi:hypothetical protein CHS0354_001542 [Potamilus streckersoni]|uniref:Uncharacterized protein n=1 Tax=Potamilus streckersoni TaxID=2493646 RepID=A0AAE0VXX9_9BIVA|nr:hypothetical protein CHS0354_001542 [Potamilus streckersoni]